MVCYTAGLKVWCWDCFGAACLSTLKPAPPCFATQSGRACSGAAEASDHGRRDLNWVPENTTKGQMHLMDHAMRYWYMSRTKNKFQTRSVCSTEIVHTNRWEFAAAIKHKKSSKHLSPTPERFTMFLIIIHPQKENATSASKKTVGLHFPV